MTAVDPAVCSANLLVGDDAENITHEYSCHLPVGHEEWHVNFIEKVSWVVESDG